MAETAHTPGSWRAKPMGGDSVVLADSHKWHPYSEGYEAYPIAVPRKAEEPGKLFDPWCAGFSHDDARLIAAAPDMLKALQAAQGVMWMAADWLEHGGSSTTMGEDYQADYDRADALINAAIARATGEKP